MSDWDTFICILSLMKNRGVLNTNFSFTELRSVSRILYIYIYISFC